LFSKSTVLKIVLISIYLTVEKILPSYEFKWFGMIIFIFI
jgi:hypothetical protein